MAQVVPETVIRRVQNPQTLRVLVYVPRWVKLVLGENLPTTAVLAVALLPVPVVNQSALYEAHVHMSSPERTRLPLLEKLDVVGVNILGN